MPKLEYFVVAESVSIDQITNRVSIFNVIEEYRTQEFPITIPQLVALSAWNFDESDKNTDFQVTIRSKHPCDKVREFRVNVQTIGVRHRITQFLSNIVVHGPGDLEFEVLINEEHAASHTVSIYQEEADSGTD